MEYSSDSLANLQDVVTPTLKNYGQELTSLLAPAQVV
jgi:hypothetical protein